MSIRHLFYCFLAGACLGCAAQDKKPEPKPEPAPKALDGDNMPAKDFLTVVRYPQFINSWAKMTGTVHHRSKGKKLDKDIEIRARFKPKEWRMQIILDGKERYLVRQIPADGIVGTTSIKQKDAGPNGVTLQDFLIRPSDLTLSFLYWNFDKELERARVKTRKCRVLQLKHPANGESVRIWIDVEFFFPLRVQWFKQGAADPIRQLDFKAGKAIKSSTNQDREFHMIQEALIADQGWKTRVKFKKIDGDEVTAKTPVPKDLFIQDEEGKAE